MAQPDLVGLLRIPGDGAAGPVDLPLERVLPAGADLGDAHGAAGAIVEPKQDRRRVLRPDLALDRLADRLRERFDRAGRFASGRDERREVGHHADDPPTGDEGHQVQPVRTDVADRPQRAAALRLEAPVPVALEQQPVLEVAAGDQADVADIARRHHLAGMLVQRVEADVEVHGVDHAAGRGEPRELAGLRSGHCQRLLADDVLAGRNDRLRLGDVEIVRRRHVNDVDGGIVEERLERRIRLRHAEGRCARLTALRRAAEDAANLDADPAQGFDMNRADEPCSDYRGADVGDVAHGRSHRYGCRGTVQEVARRMLRRRQPERAGGPWQRRPRLLELERSDVRRVHDRCLAGPSAEVACHPRGQPRGVRAANRARVGCGRCRQAGASRNLGVGQTPSG